MAACCRSCSRRLSPSAIRRSEANCRRCAGVYRASYRLRVCPDCGGEHKSNSGNVCPVCRARRKQRQEAA